MPPIFCLASTLHTGNKQGRDLLHSLLAHLPKDFRVCYVGAFMGDKKDWAKVTLDFFKKDMKAHVSAPRLSDADVDLKAAREAIERCDVLYLEGGDTVEGVGHIRERGLFKSFEAAARNAKLVFGLSGGACAAPPYTIGYDDEGNSHIADLLGMGPPLPLDVHDEPDWGEMRSLLELVKEHRPDLPHEGIVAPTGAALMVHPDGRLASRGKVPCERRSLGKNGKWKVVEIPLE